jgi:hypothetical protein
MQEPNISSASTAKIEAIEVVDESVELIDIEVEGQHTFWVSNNDSDWVLTHNSGAPDIDCVHEDHLVVMTDGTHKRAVDIIVGDVVLGGDGMPHAVTATYARNLRPFEDAVWVRVRANDGTLGHILVVPGHKFVRADGVIVYCRDLKVGDELMASCGSVEVVSIEHGGWGSSNARYVDLTVEDDHRFHVVPFNTSILSGGDPSHDVGYCMGVIPGTFLACGEGDNFCSDWCASKRRTDHSERNYEI